MKANAEHTAFAAYLTVCMTCGGTVGHLERGWDGKSRIQPCGHAARLKLVANPRLGQRPA